MSSDEASSSSDSDALSRKVQKPKDKSKKKSKPSAVVTEHGKDESSQIWAYEPPEGATLVNHGGDAGDFDWDALANDDDLELWVIRVPEGVKPKHLQGLSLDAPSSSKTARLGSLARKHTTYDIWSLGEDNMEAVGAEEVKNLSCLLPRKKKSGRLFPAPEIATRHIVLSAQPAAPTMSAPEEGDNMSWSTGQNPPRPSYPKELLKHKFMPYGSLAPSNDAAAMEVDSQPIPQEPEDRLARSKRRKVDGEPKKSKKSKTAKE